MRGQTGFFDIDERLGKLSAKGDELERLNTLVDFELFRGDLERAVPRSDRSRGGRPAFDHVLMFKALIAGQPQPVGRANRVFDQGPAVVHALSRSGACQRSAGCEYDLDLSPHCQLGGACRSVAAFAA